MDIGKIFTSLLLCSGMAFNTVAAENAVPDTTIDGLHRVDGTVLALVYAKPEVDLSHYNRFYLVEPQVAFKKNWLRDQNRIPQSVR